MSEEGRRKNDQRKKETERAKEKEDRKSGKKITERAKKKNYEVEAFANELSKFRKRLD